jgi:hypothetical protein
VPLLAIFEALGVDVKWDGTTKNVTSTKGQAVIHLNVGVRTAYKDGTPITLDVPAKIVNGRTLVPLRFVSEALGAKVAWDGNTQTVAIFSCTPPADGLQAVPPKPEPHLIEREFAWEYAGNMVVSNGYGNLWFRRKPIPITQT